MSAEAALAAARAALEAAAAAVEVAAEQLKAPSTETDLRPLRATGFPPRRLREAIRRGTLRGKLVGGRYYVDMADLNAWIDSRPVRPLPAAKQVPRETAADRVISRELQAGRLRVVR